MNLISSIICLAFLSTIVECQPLADSRSGYINFFAEMMNPVFRQHRARLRPFANQIGSPVINIRGARDVSKQEGKNSISECLFSFDSIYCAGIDFAGNKTSTECDASRDLDLKYHKFSIGDLRVRAEEGQLPIAKFYLYTQRENSTWFDFDQTGQVLSLSLKEDNLTDKGIKVGNRKCWTEMLRFFTSLKNTQDILVEQEVAQNITMTKSIRVLANLNFF